MTIRQARALVLQTHRRLPEVQGGLWAVGLERDGEAVGCAIVGNPARVWMSAGVLCVLRVAVVEGCRNGCSMLYGATSRAAKAMGASALVTYTHQDEPGTSLKAAGWLRDGMTTGGEYDRPCRDRQPALFPEPKWRWWAPWSQRP